MQRLVMLSLYITKLGQLISPISRNQRGTL
jgi:hypothetical protein